MATVALPPSALAGQPRTRLLRARSDDALVEMVRQGRDDAFEIIVGRYRDRLLAYARHTLRGSDEAEDVVQDVFIRAHRALRRDDRPMQLKAWLYRIAHNRCMDVLRRPLPLPSELSLEEAGPADTAVEAQQRDDLRQLVEDIAGLPDQQRSALVIRELEGLSYEELAETLQTTVPAIKSLLVRARMGLAETAEARALPCASARAQIAAGERLSATVRRHLRSCDGCGQARRAARPLRTRSAAFAPVFLAPLSRLIALLPGGGAGAAEAVSGAGGGRALATVASVAVLGGAVATSPPVTEREPAPKAAAFARSAPAPVRRVAPAPPARPAPVAPSSSPVASSPPASKDELTLDANVNSPLDGLAGAAGAAAAAAGSEPAPSGPGLAAIAAPADVATVAPGASAVLDASTADAAGPTASAAALPEPTARPAGEPPSDPVAGADDGAGTGGALAPAEPRSR